MADEIPGQNVINVVHVPPLWVAYVGPDPESGIAEASPYPACALVSLAARLVRAGYVFDPTWTPR